MDTSMPFRPVWGEPTTFDLGDWTVYSSPPPGSGPVLALILNILENYDFLPGADLDPVFYHRLVEAYKWAYGAKTHLGDPADPEITDYINAVHAAVILSGGALKFWSLLCQVGMSVTMRRDAWRPYM